MIETRGLTICLLLPAIWLHCQRLVGEQAEQGVSVTTRQSSFTIPFSIAPSETPPREIQLYVSRDGGVQWDLYARQRPTSTGFSFQATSDGDHWFAARTVISTDQPDPPTQFRPELHVLIDTNPPKLELSATVGESGEIVAAWRAIDDNLVAESLSIEYEELVDEQPSGKWQRVAIESPRQQAVHSDLMGRASWWPENVSGTVRIRATVHDRAGNVAKVNRRIVRVNTTPRLSETEPDRRPAAKVDFAAQGKEDYYQIPKPPVDPENATRSASNWKRLIPEGEQLRMTHSRRVTLQYDVLSVGPSGTNRVELWATRDGGETWENWGVDTDNQSPMVVEIGEEGVFGFRITITSGLGLSTPAPRPGDLADLWIGVDLTKPIGQITSVRFGTGMQAGQLIVNWEASDLNLGDRPIGLSFSTSPQGPWQEIATDLPNSGQYQWQVKAGHAREVYLQLTIADDAGNVHEDRPEQPINLEGLSPRGRISGFRGSP